MHNKAKQIASEVDVNNGNHAAKSIRATEHHKDIAKKLNRMASRRSKACTTHPKRGIANIAKASAATLEKIERLSQLAAGTREALVAR